jgi:hypothetical protein
MQETKRSTRKWTEMNANEERGKVIFVTKQFQFPFPSLCIRSWLLSCLPGLLIKNPFRSCR